MLQLVLTIIITFYCTSVLLFLFDILFYMSSSDEIFCYDYLVTAVIPPSIFLCFLISCDDKQAPAVY